MRVGVLRARSTERGVITGQPVDFCPFSEITEAGDAGDTEFRDVQISGLQSKAGDLRDEVAEYESLRDGDTTVIEASSLAGVADALIKARIARGWTQRDLAERLGVAEQQLQRYESTAYRTASLARLCDIAEALEVTFSERAELRDTAIVA